MLKAILAGALCLACGFFHAAPAAAQEAAFWDDPDVAGCCDANDCEIVEGRVTFTPEGWRVAGWEGALTLEGGKVWWKPTTTRPVGCSFEDQRQRRQLKCLFFREEEG